MMVAAQSSASRHRGSTQVRDVVLRGPRTGTEVTIARLVIRGRPPEQPRAARRLLLSALCSWPDSFTAKFLLAPGGFVSEPWPTHWSNGWGWNTEDDALTALEERVTNCVASIVDATVRHRARGKVKAIAFGIDVGPDEKTRASAELAVVYDLETASWRLTGKSFLRGDQRMVVRIAQLASHFMEVAGERVLVLGCHDLNIFSPRGRSVQQPHGRLADLRREMDRQLELFAPTVALQLPHGTDTPRTWIQAWNALARATPLRAWASGIAFYHPSGDAERATFEEVCSKTFGGAPCLDLVA